MGEDVKAFHALGLENGETCIISTDKRQMARWYALDYLKEKPVQTENGSTGSVTARRLKARREPHLISQNM